ncbi:MAG: hypothetical protein A2Y41_10390 [Spirochaetes bacterium GWB1_36_13]|nr:MAG: hypothetical protein A2Y41_10390 [Spirochaetes bacterium GWB1_36_13]
MNLKKGFLGGMIAYMILYIFNFLYLIILGSIKFENDKIKSMIIFMLFLIVGVGAIGGLLSILFLKIQSKIPFNNVYVKSGAFHMLITILLSLTKIINGQIEIITIVNFLFTFLIGVLCFYFYNLFNREPMKNAAL